MRVLFSSKYLLGYKVTKPYSDFSQLQSIKKG